MVPRPRRRKYPSLKPLKEIPASYSFVQGTHEPRLHHRLLAPGEPQRYRGEVIPMTPVQRATLEGLGVKIYETGIIEWPAPLAAQARAAELGKKRMPVQRTIGFDRAERFARHRVEGSEQTRERALTVAPLLAGVTQHVIETDLHEPAAREQVAKDLQVLGLMLGKSSRGSMKAARHAMRDAIGLLLFGNVPAAVGKMVKAHNDLADRLSESNKIVPRTERRQVGMQKRNADRRAGFRSWTRELDEDIRALTQFQLRPAQMTQLADKYLRQSRAYSRIATQQMEKDIIQPENRSLSETLQEMSTAIRQFRDTSSRTRAQVNRLHNLFQAARRWGHVRHARSFAVGASIFRESANWTLDQRGSLLRSQFRWAADNIDHWAASGEHLEAIPGWLDALGVAMKNDFRFRAFAPSIGSAKRLSLQGKYTEAVAALEKMVPSLSE